MDLIVTATQMRQMEEKIIAGGLPAALLMERAALFAAKHIEKQIEKKFSKRKYPKILIVCGTGNNGADGLALARILYEHGFAPQVWLVGDRGKQSDLSKLQYEILMQWPYFSQNIRDTKPIRQEYDIIVDALLGIGLSRPIKGKILHAVKWMNAQRAFKLALDIPTGISSDTGEQLGDAFLADKTVTFGAYKAGQFLGDGKRCAGVVKLDTCGIQYVADTQEKQLFRMTRTDLYPFMKRNPQGNKGSFGKLGIIAGSEQSAGAAKLCVQASFLSGAGYVKLITHDRNRKIILGSFPETVLLTYMGHEAETGLTADEENALGQLYAFADAIAAGPGIGQGQKAKERLEKLIALFINDATDKKLILDADALNLISSDDKLFETLRQIKEPPILTPHVLEFSRLSGLSIEEIKKDKIKIASQFAMQNHVILVLKDAQTVIAAEDGRSCINTTGNDGMAVAGSGDTLCGIVTALAAREKDSFLAACAGVYLHGLAGDAARGEMGAHAMRPTDLAKHLIPVMKRLGKEAKENEAL